MVMRTHIRLVLIALAQRDLTCTMLTSQHPSVPLNARISQPLSLTIIGHLPLAATTSIMTVIMHMQTLACAMLASLGMPVLTSHLC